MWLAERRLIDVAFIEEHTRGFAWALRRACALAPNLDAVADATGIDRQAIAVFYGWFASTSRVVSCYSQGVNQSAQGTDKVNAIINCHLATGRIGKPGSGPLSLTGQPNAMGGREVGGLANMLAAHMGFSEAERDRVRRFWNAPNLVSGQGLKAVDMFDAVADGRIKALWVMGTNPAVSLPRADAVRAALARLDLLVVSENVASNDTVAHAHVRLPAAAWGEKDGTVTNSERCISRQRAFLPLPGERAARLVDAERGGAAARLRRGIRLPLGRRDFPGARASLGLRERGSARLRYFRRRRPRAERLSTGWSRSSGRSAAAMLQPRGCSPTAASSPRIAWRASWPSRRRACRPPSRTRGRSC